VLRCEEVPLRGLLAANVYQTLVGISNTCGIGSRGTQASHHRRC
jgi:hypothetical protein